MPAAAKMYFAQNMGRDMGMIFNDGNNGQKEWRMPAAMNRPELLPAASMGTPPSATAAPPRLLTPNRRPYSSVRLLSA